MEFKFIADFVKKFKASGENKAMNGNINEANVKPTVKCKVYEPTIDEFRDMGKYIRFIEKESAMDGLCKVCVLYELGVVQIAEFFTS